jgi:hypothetical protein
MVLEVPGLRKETDDLADVMNALLDWARDHDDNISFVGPTAAAIGEADVEVEVHVQSVNNILERFSLVGEVTVDITGGSATDKTITAGTRVSAVDGQLVVPITDGVGSFLINSSALNTETVILGLIDSGSSGLDVADTHTVTYS